MYRIIFICANGNEYFDIRKYKTEGEALDCIALYSNSDIYCEENEGGLIVGGRVESW